MIKTENSDDLEFAIALCMSRVPATETESFASPDHRIAKELDELGIEYEITPHVPDEGTVA